jgi:methylated-DNA-protein-cysteine methyltransferase-like protein
VSDSFERIRRVVARIPHGKVMTYGDVARAAGMPGAARSVGYAMRALGKSVPWQRVLGRKNLRTAHITIVDPRGKSEQRRLLEKEGVQLDARGGIALEKFGWPRAPSSPKSRPPKSRSPKSRSPKSRSPKSQPPKSRPRSKAKRAYRIGRWGCHLAARLQKLTCRQSVQTNAGPVAPAPALALALAFAPALASGVPSRLAVCPRASPCVVASRSRE